MKRKPNPFLILRLPLLTLQKILLYLDLLNLIDFTLCSKKSRAATRSITIKKNYSIKLSFEPQVKVEIHHLISKKYILFYNDLMETRNHLLDAELVGQDRSLREISINWMKKWIPYLCDIFNNKIEHLNIYHAHVRGHLKDLSLFLSNSQLQFRKCLFTSVAYCRDEITRFRSDEFQFFLNTVKINERLYVLFNTDPEGSTFEPVQSYNYGVLVSGYSQWITMKSLVASYQFSNVMLLKTNFSSSDLNTFLRAWLSGKLPNLRCFFAAVKGDVSLEAVITGLNYIELKEPINIEHTDRLGVEHVFPYRIRLQQNGGREAKCVVHPFENRSSIWNQTFFLSVD